MEVRFRQVSLIMNLCNRDVTITFIYCCSIFSLICGIMIYATVFSTLILSRGVLAKDEYLSVLKDSGPASTGLTFIW